MWECVCRVPSVCKALTASSSKAYQYHEMAHHDTDVMGLNPSQVELEGA